MMGCYIPSFMENGPLVLEEKISEVVFFTIYGRGGHLGHVTNIIHVFIYFHFLVSNNFYTKFG